MALKIRPGGPRSTGGVRVAKGSATVINSARPTEGRSQRRRAPKAPAPRSGPRVSMPDRGVVSVLIPAYRTPQLCLDAVRSVLSQQLPRGWRLEVLVGVDACPTTRAALEQASFDARVQVVNFKTNGGPYRCLNDLLVRASGDPILILDSDDAMLPGRIEAQLEALRKYDFVASRHRVTRDGRNTSMGPPCSAHPTLRNTAYPLHSTWAVRRHVYRYLGGYQDWRCGADTDFMIRALASGYPMVVLQEPLAVRRIRADQMTAAGTSTGPGSPHRRHAQARVVQDLSAYRRGAPVQILQNLEPRSTLATTRSRARAVSERVGVLMPTLPHRAATAESVVRGLLRQGVAEVVVQLQGHAAIPAWANDSRVTAVRNAAGTGPMARWSKLPPGVEFVLSVDDDLIYPPDYVERTVAHLRRLGPGHVVSYHCSHWPAGKSELDERVILDFSMPCDRYVPKTYMGCGVAAFYADDLRRVERNAPPLFDRLDDVWMSAAIARAGLKLYRPPSPLRWIGSTDAQKDGIYAAEIAEGFRSRRAAIAEARKRGSWPLTPRHREVA